ncbi:extracellular solute-binding protein [Treponema sp.]|uniref:extracellular solute-binding protein n=1 Tax=Treponema sp. TaxID=166 RepID=UPI00388EDBA3
MKKFIKIILLSLTAGVLFTACERVDLEGIGELNKVELWYGPYSNDAPPLPDDCVLIDHVEKDLGIKLKTVPLPSGKEDQMQMVLDAAKTNSLPDIFMVDRNTLVTLLKENKIARVDKMYEKMPKRSYQMYNEEARAATSFDGYSYGLAQSGSIDRNEGVLIRKDWLDNLGLAVPVTTEDFYQVMRAFTYNDPDGNGLNDTFGYGAYIEIRAIEEGLGSRFAPFFGAFGVEGTYNASKKNPGLNVRKPEYLEAMEYVRSLVADRLIDPQWATYTKNQFRAAWKNGRFGIMREQNAAFALESNYKDFDEKFPDGEWILINPPVGPRGESSVGANSTGYRIYAISKRAQELGKLPVIARLLEWMSTDGYATVAYGEEAVNYMVDDAGNITTEGLPDPELAYTKKSAAPLLQLRNMVFYNSDEELKARYPTWYSKNGKEMSALKTLRAMQAKTWTVGIGIPGISKELKTFYEQGLKDFAMGNRSLSTWDEWLKEFDELGGADWEKRCKIHVEENNLLLDNNKM